MNNPNELLCLLKILQYALIFFELEYELKDRPFSEYVDKLIAIAEKYKPSDLLPD